MTPREMASMELAQLRAEHGRTPTQGEIRERYRLLIDAAYELLVDVHASGLPAARVALYRERSAAWLRGEGR